MNKMAKLFETIFILVAGTIFIYNNVFAQCYTQDQMDEAVMNERSRWDANGDNTIGLEEAIRALRIVSGINSNANDQIPLSIAENPSVSIFFNDPQADMNQWILRAYEYWQAREGNSWESYIETITLPEPPDTLPELPQAQSTTDPVCEAVNEGRCFYISPENGADTNPGTFDQPWKTYSNLIYYDWAHQPENHINNNGGLKPGDVIYFMSGTYDTIKVSYLREDNGNEVYGALYLQNIHGTEIAPITFKAYPGEHPVLLPRLPNTQPGETGRTDKNELPPIRLWECSFIVIDGIEIRECYGDGIQISLADNIEIKNCWIHDVDGYSQNNLGGIEAQGKNISIHHNLLNDNYDRSRENESGNIWLGHIDAETNVTNNIIFNSNSGGGWGIWCKYPANSDSAQLLIEKNILQNCKRWSINTLTFNSYVRHNLIVDSARMELWHFNLFIENNTIIRSPAFRYRPVPTTQTEEQFYASVDKFYFRNNFIIDNSDNYSGEEGIMTICVYCSDEVFDLIVGSNNLMLNNNVYSNPNMDLNAQEAYFLFHGGEPKGGRYNFVQWQSLVGLDVNSIVMEAK